MISPIVRKKQSGKTLIWRGKKAQWGRIFGAQNNGRQIKRLYSIENSSIINTVTLSVYDDWTLAQG